MINVKRAKQLKKKGFKFRIIGKILAKEDKRFMPYQANSVQQAIVKCKKHINM